MPFLIIYSHRRSDYTLDIISADVWVASAKNWHDADLVAQALDADARSRTHGNASGKAKQQRSTARVKSVQG